MKKLQLKNSDEVALVDDLYFDFLSTFTWKLSPNGYAYVFKDHRIKSLWMSLHMLVQRLYKVNLKDGLVTDHVDRNKLNNQIANLKRVTRAENALNRGPTADQILAELKR